MAVGARIVQRRIIERHDLRGEVTRELYDTADLLPRTLPRLLLVYEGDLARAMRSLRLCIENSLPPDAFNPTPATRCLAREFRIVDELDDHARLLIAEGY